MATHSALVEKDVDAQAMPAPQTQIQDTLLQSVSWTCDHYNLGSHHRP